MMDEVFGADCYVSQVIWRSSDNSNNDAKKFSNDHNTILIYAKTAEWTSNRLTATPGQVPHYSNPDGDPRGSWFDGNPVNSPNPRKNLMYTVTSPQGVEISPPPNGWRWSRETMEEKIKSGEIRFTANGTGIRRRTYLADHSGLPASSLWVDLAETGHNRQAKAEIKRLFPGTRTADLFATPKPERLLRKILRVATAPGDIILDCFLGSGTTAAVAHKMGRRWVGIEREQATIETYARPRLMKIVAGDDPGGITRDVGWEGGGGFRVLEVAPSMFDVIEEQVFLSGWATNGKLAEATAAQMGYEYASEPPFAGRRGRSRLAVVDGLVNEDVVRLLIGALAEDERLLVCGTAVDPAAQAVLREVRSGSSARKIPQSILQEYRQATRWDLPISRESEENGRPRQARLLQPPARQATLQLASDRVSGQVET